jgi:hypothetical protein
MGVPVLVSPGCCAEPAVVVVAMDVADDVPGQAADGAEPAASFTAEMQRTQATNKDNANVLFNERVTVSSLGLRLMKSQKPDNSIQN